MHLERSAARLERSAEYLIRCAAALGWWLDEGVALLPWHDGMGALLDTGSKMGSSIVEARVPRG